MLIRDDLNEVYAAVNGNQCAAAGIHAESSGAEGVPAAGGTEDAV